MPISALAAWNGSYDVKISLAEALIEGILRNFNHGCYKVK